MIPMRGNYTALRHFYEKTNYREIIAEIILSTFFYSEPHKSIRLQP